MAAQRLLYLALAVIGTVLPLRHFIGWLSENGWSLPAMLDAWNANSAVTGLTLDLTISAITLTFWILIETVSRKTWPNLIAIPAIYMIGVSCGLPLYLYLRTRSAA